MKQHLITVKWTGAWKHRFVLTCSCGYEVKDLRKQYEVQDEAVKHLTGGTDDFHNTKPKNNKV